MSEFKEAYENAPIKKTYKCTLLIISFSTKQDRMPQRKPDENLKTLSASKFPFQNSTHYRDVHCKTYGTFQRPVLAKPPPPSVCKMTFTVCAFLRRKIVIILHDTAYIS